MVSDAPKETPRSEGAVYRKIADSIRNRIASGELGEGDRLPPIRALAGELGVNRDTISLAYDLLQAEGLVEGAVGRGTFVRATVRAEPMAVTTRLGLAEATESLLRFDRGSPRHAVGSDVVSLHTLVPEPALYPANEFRRALNKVLSESGPELLMYGGARGDPWLREVLAARLRADSVGVSPEEVVLCHGASQGISLALRLFAGHGDAIAVEVPTYGNVLSTLVALGLRPEAVPMRADGEGGCAPDLDAVDRVLARPDVKAFYTIPTFHNPLGTTTSLEHREGLLAVAARHGKPLIEDAFEMDLRYEGVGVPSLAALDEQGLVVQLCSFSKSLFPGARAGAVVARGRVVEALTALKRATDLSDSMPLQAALADLVTSGVYDRHLGRLRRELRARRDALVSALERWMPEGTRWTRPEGGYQLWVDLPDDAFALDTRDLLTAAAQAGVTFQPGSSFLPDGVPSRGMRLTVAQADAVAIERGIEALGSVVRARFAQDPAARQAAAVQL